MRFCILQSSPRAVSNTAELVGVIDAELRKGGAETDVIRLADRRVRPCRGCYCCQQVTGVYGCVQTDDDMQGIVDSILASDCLILASPIYTWYCTAEMKAVLDRFYGMNKFYGAGSGQLWAGLRIALVTTHGYDRVYGAGLFEAGIQRLCEHSGLDYLGMFSGRDVDDLASFQTPEMVEGARSFARRLIAGCDK